MIPSRIRFALVPLLLVVELSALGCSSGSLSSGSPPADPGDAGVPVLFLGDSLTVGARLWGELEATADAAGWTAEVVAEDGQDVRWGLEQVRIRDQVPDVVVVGLGTNPGPSPATFADDAASLVGELVSRGAGTIVWWPPGDTPDAGRQARAAALRRAAVATGTAGGGQLRVPDWPGELARHPDWLGDDAVHLTNEGYRGLSAFLVAQLGDSR